MRRLTGWNGIIQWRRLLGLFAFFYVCLHLSTYVVLDQFFDPTSIVADIAKRRYITVGFDGFLILLPLAITSTTGWIRRLGRRWQRLHRFVYLAAVCGVIHLLWIVKGDDLREPALYGGILALLMSVRAYYWIRLTPACRLPAAGYAAGLHARCVERRPTARPALRLRADALVPQRGNMAISLRAMASPSRRSLSGSDAGRPGPC